VRRTHLVPDRLWQPQNSEISFERCDAALKSNERERSARIRSVVIPFCWSALCARSASAPCADRNRAAPDEVDELIETVRQNRYGDRDALMVLLAYRHGLRAAEV
jgi:hypothetical protein